MRPEIAEKTGKGARGEQARRAEEREERGEGEREMLSNLTSEGISTEAAVKANNEVIL